MPRCSGCSKFYPGLAAEARCGRCTHKPSRPVEEWGACDHCGNVYEHMESALCYACSDDRSVEPKDTPVAQLARDATSQPVNPRAHTGPDGRVALSSRVHDQLRDDERRQQAHDILLHMASGYGEAVQRAVPGTRVAPQKLKMAVGGTSVQITKPVRKLNVKISKITDYDKGRYRTGPEFNAVSTEYHEDQPMATILEEIRVMADNAYTRSRGYRVFEQSEFALLWTSSKTVVDNSLLQRDLGFLWRSVASNSFIIPTADARRKVIDFHVVVHYDPDRDLVEETSDTDKSNNLYKTRQSKRANSIASSDLRTQTITSGSSAIKKPKVLAAGKGAYKTVIQNLSGVPYNVVQCSFIAGPDDASYLWLQDEEPIRVTVEKESFASGSTKHAYKMLLKGSFYASKRFYEIGEEPGKAISNDDNLKHLKDELLRQCVASGTVQRFLEHARKLKISVYNLKVADAFIALVTSGNHKGLSWIVDPLLSEAAEMQKFSGNTQAGANGESLVGRTCDAFAHFSLFDSNAEIVFVDIQGIDTENLPLASKGAMTAPHCLILFDLMIHSLDFSHGLRDEGEYGIQHFVEQHKCNCICKALRLPSVDAIWKKFRPITSTSKGKQKSHGDHSRSSSTSSSESSALRGLDKTDSEEEGQAPAQ
ncbi:atypical/Alpha protein kinase [Panaeolus papilionaceus]|nr:atypical/Alpha protein kinase [Panaeolus papilionaceus]